MNLASLLSRARPSGTGWYRMDCPFCPSRVGKEDRKASLGYRRDTGVYHCFRCGIVGHLHGSDVGLPPEQPESVEPPEALSPPPGYLSLTGPASTALVLEPARAFLLRRRVPEDVWADLGLGVCLDGKWAGRVIVPVRAADGTWVGYVGRDYTGRAQLPYLFPRGMRKGSLVYNEAALTEESEVPVLAVEGVFDAFAVWPDSVAFLGKPTEDQFDALVVARRPVVMVLDGDAHREGWKWTMRLRLEGQRAGAVRLPPCVDPDEVDPVALLHAAYDSLAVWEAVLVE